MNKKEKKILNIVTDLDNTDQSSVLLFAEFILDKAKQEGRLNSQKIVETKPLAISRPKEERVVSAIKRLSETYPMLNKNLLLDKTASLMTAHMLHGQEAVDVIDELEVLFKQHYQDFCQNNEQK